ncbi:hypothetical protein DRQ27_02175 [bacterium]|nr:MAG: hypothetical protein DRQ27_02175 [bacterium]
MTNFDEKLKELWDATKPKLSDVEKAALRARFWAKMKAKRSRLFAYAIATAAVVVLALVATLNIEFHKNDEIILPVEISEYDLYEDFAYVSADTLLLELVEEEPDEVIELVAEQVDDAELLSMLTPDEREEILSMLENSL